MGGLLVGGGIFRGETREVVEVNALKAWQIDPDNKKGERTEFHT